MRSNRRLRRRMSSSSDASSDDESAQQRSASTTGKSPDDASGSKWSGSNDTKEECGEVCKEQKDHQAQKSNGAEMSSKEILEAAARAQLRTKFDHVGIDPHSPSAMDRSVPGIPNRGMTSSPPPPGLAMASAAGLSSHGGVSGLGRHVGEYSLGSGNSSADSVPHPSTVQQNPMPFFAAANENATPVPAVHANQSLQVLHVHHASALSGAPVNNPPLELVVGPDASGTSTGAASGTSVTATADVADLDVSVGGIDSLASLHVLTLLFFLFAKYIRSSQGDHPRLILM